MRGRPLGGGGGGVTCVISSRDVTLGLTDHELQHLGVAKGCCEQHWRVAAAVGDVEQRRAVEAASGRHKLLRNLKPVGLKLPEADDDAERRVLVVILNSGVCLHSVIPSRAPQSGGRRHRWQLGRERLSGGGVRADCYGMSLRQRYWACDRQESQAGSACQSARRRDRRGQLLPK